MEVHGLLGRNLLRTLHCVKCRNFAVTPGTVYQNCLLRSVFKCDIIKRPLHLSSWKSDLYKFYQDPPSSESSKNRLDEDKSFRKSSVGKRANTAQDRSQDVGKDRTQRNKYVASRNNSDSFVGQNHINQIPKYKVHSSISKVIPPKEDTHEMSGKLWNSADDIQRITEPVMPLEEKKDLLDEVADHWVKGFVVHLSKLPYSVTATEIISFLGGVKVVGNEAGVKFTYTISGRPSGQAFVELMTKEDLKQALEKHGEMIGKRYITVRTSTRKKMEAVTERRGEEGAYRSKTGHFIYMEKLPPDTTLEDILKFLEPFEPVYVLTKLLGIGRARVDFACLTEAEDAMIKRYEKMKGQRVRMFLNSEFD